MPRRCNGCYSYATKQRVEWWRFLLTICFLVAIFSGGIVFFVFWAVTPLQVRAQIEDARLYDFSLATSLAYNISIAVIVRNPNGAAVRYTKPLLAALVFHDRPLRNITVIDLGTRHQMLKKELRLCHAEGMVLLYMLDTAAAKDFGKQNATGVFKLELRLSGEIAFQRLQIIGKKRKLALSCPLSLQLAPPGPAVVVFRQVSCKLEQPQKLYF